MTIIYKYKKFDNYSKELLEEQSLWLSNLDDFNDAFEGMAVWYTAGNVKQFEDWLQRNNEPQGNIEKMKKTFIERNMFICHRLDFKAESALVYCFSLINDDILMWSHYADNNKGICLGFEVEDIQPQPDNLSCSMKLELEQSEFNFDKYPILKNYVGSMHKVIYSEYAPSNNRLDQKTYLEDFSSIVTKSRSWSYEQEVRMVIPAVLFPNKSQKAKFKRQALKEIIFGLKCEQSTIDEVVKILATKYPEQKIKLFKCIYPNVPINQNEVNSVRYELQIQAIN